MAKTESDSTRREQRKAGKWALTIFLVTILVSGTISFLSNEIMSRTGIAAAFVILLIIVVIGILFDIVGVAVTSANEKPFHSMAAKKMPEAVVAIRMLRRAAIVS